MRVALGSGQLVAAAAQACSSHTSAEPARRERSSAGRRPVARRSASRARRPTRPQPARRGRIWRRERRAASGQQRGDSRATATPAPAATGKRRAAPATPRTVGRRLCRPSSHWHWQFAVRVAGWNGDHAPAAATCAVRGGERLAGYCCRRSAGSSNGRLELAFASPIQARKCAYSPIATRESNGSRTLIPLRAAKIRSHVSRGSSLQFAAVRRRRASELACQLALLANAKLKRTQHTNTTKMPN